jgi:hypothetical protein
MDMTAAPTATISSATIFAAATYYYGTRGTGTE